MRVRVSAQRRLEEVGELGGAVGDVAWLGLGVGLGFGIGLGIGFGLPLNLASVSALMTLPSAERLCRCREVQGDAGRCGEMRGDTAES